MDARSAVFDLYGDHLAERSKWAPIAAIVRLLESLDIAPAATRTAVSRMVREDWLSPSEAHRVRGYAATTRATRRLQAAWDRIYAPGPLPWDGRWHLTVTEHISDRSRRDRTAANFAYLGYSRLAPDTWVAPRRSPELNSTLVDVGRTEFFSTLDGDGRALASAQWDLVELASAYNAFDHLLAAACTDARAASAEDAFAIRSRLVHEWRKFLFRDPGLPAEVLPTSWPGFRVADRFLEVTAALRPAASAHVDQCLRDAGAPSSQTVATQGDSL